MQNGCSCWLGPAPSASPGRPRTLGQTVTCCGGMSHTTTKSLVFQREPGTTSVLVLWGPTLSILSPRCQRKGLAEMQDKCFHASSFRFLPPVSFFCWVRKKIFRSPCNVFFPISFMFFFCLVNLFLKSVTLFYIHSFHPCCSAN